MPSQLTLTIGVGGPTRICPLPSGEMLLASVTTAPEAVVKWHCGYAL